MNSFLKTLSLGIASFSCFPISAYAATENVESEMHASRPAYADIVHMAERALLEEKNTESWKKALNALEGAQGNTLFSINEVPTIAAIKRLVVWHFHALEIGAPEQDKSWLPLFKKDYNQTSAEGGASASPTSGSQLSLKEQDLLVIQRAVHQLTTLPQQVSVERRLADYLDASRILNSYVGTEKDEMRKAMKEGIEEWLKQNNGKWPEKEALAVKEQFYWNLHFFDSLMVKELFATSHSLNWKKLRAFCDPYLQGFRPDENPSCMKEILPIYLAFTEDNASRRRFLAFCDPYLQGLRPDNKPSCMGILHSVYQAFPEDEAKNKFLAFCDPYLQGLRPDNKPSCMEELLPIYQAFPEDNEERRKFLEFCGPYLQGNDIKPFRMMDFLPIYQAFPEDNEERRKILEFCDFYLQGIRHDQKKNFKMYLFQIYLAFPNDETREKFLTFCKTYLELTLPERRISSMKGELLPLYLAFPNDETREKFLTFCNPYLQNLLSDNPIFSMKDVLLPIYLAFSDDEARRKFLAFCDSNLQGAIPGMQNLLPIYLAFSDDEARGEFTGFSHPYLQQGLYSTVKPSLMQSLFVIYQTPSLKEDFDLYVHRHLGLNVSSRIKGRLVSSNYPSRTYLCSERALAALKAETAPVMVRKQSVYETSLKDSLPALWAADPFLQRQRAQQGAVNTHEFDDLYELDRKILFGESDLKGYLESDSTIERTIFNGQGSLINYKTNSEVEDFIGYLDEISKRKKPFKIDGKDIQAQEAVSIIKQMLGLEEKKGNTTGDFAPYLGHSMYYAKPDSFKGDEMIGRVWFMLKQLGQQEVDKAIDKSDTDLENALREAEEYKRSMILAILEAAEVSETNVHTHCQTRMTGELMKLISWHLPGSKLRPLIAAEDLPPATTDAEIQMRITLAPERAQQLFDTLKKEDTGSIRILIEKHLIEGTEPELWERYQAYYDDLYRRTPILNEDRSFKDYKKDEHILMRDNHGNLVSLYQAEGSLRETPLIVYHQAEFQVFEQTFTELMKKQFEEQRGLMY